MEIARSNSIISLKKSLKRNGFRRPASPVFSYRLVDLTVRARIATETRPKQAAFLAGKKLIIQTADRRTPEISSAIRIGTRKQNK